MESVNGSERVVAIVFDGVSCQIIPADTLVAVNDKVVFYNLTGDKVKVKLANPDVFGGTEFPVDMKTPATLSVAANASRGAYVYTAFCDKIQGEAHASIPRIIIYKDAK